MSSPDPDLNEQIQNKFIRNIVKPYAMNPYMNGESTSDETASVPKPVLEKTDVDTLLKNFDNDLPTYSGNPNRSPIVDFTAQPHISEEKLDYIVETLEQLQKKQMDSYDNRTIFIIIIFFLLISNIVLLRNIFLKK